MDIISEFKRKREQGNERILNFDFLPYKRFFALDSGAYRVGTIPSKYKELMGLVGSAVLRCNDCIHYHIERCVSEGCSIDELNEALNISLVIGGSIVIPHLRYAYQVIEALGLIDEQNKYKGGKK
mgnify:CR=1 FL=1